MLLRTTRYHGVRVPLQYTPGQLRALVGIPQETFRHWKKALGPLRRGRGHSPCFAPGDLVAVAVARVLVTDIGVRIGALEQVADTLFRICNCNHGRHLNEANSCSICAKARHGLLPT